mgnify:CR=1 FL=1
MEITIRTPQMQDYDRFSAIMDQVQQMHRGVAAGCLQTGQPVDHKGTVWRIPEKGQAGILPRRTASLLVFWKCSSAMWKARRR